MSKYLVVKGPGPDFILRANTYQEVSDAKDELKKKHGKSKIQVFKKDEFLSEK